MGNAHFSNVKPVPIKYSDNLYDTFRLKDTHQYLSVQKFLGVRGPFFKKVPHRFPGSLPHNKNLREILAEILFYFA